MARHLLGEQAPRKGLAGSTPVLSAKKLSMSLDRKERFIRIYANVPLGVRQEIILVLEDGRPISWNVAFVEIESDTPLSKVIMEKLEKLQII